MERRIKEAVRYLGYGRNAADERTLALIEDAFAELERTAAPKSVCRIFDVEQTEDGRIIIGNMEIRSSSLGRNLKGCTKAVLFGATLGAGTDMLIRRASLTDMAKAVVLQSCAAALLEEYCDEEQLKIGRELEKQHLYLRPRFSPGYGDFDIQYQEPSYADAGLCKEDRAYHDGKLYDDACKISHCFDRCESGKGAVPD